MGNVKALNLEILEQKREPWLEQIPSRILSQPAVAQRFRSPEICIDRNRKSSAKNLETGNVVVVFMRNDDAIQARRADTRRFEALCDLSGAEPGIDQDPALPCSD